MTLDFTALEALIRQDPRGRGVAGYRHHGQWLAEGMLESAARDLASRAGAVAIVTGFCVADAEPPVAETDGPPGALYLARALSALGSQTALVSDGSAMSLLEIGCRLWQLDAELIEAPLAHCVSAAWVDDFFDSSIGRRLTHLISIERVGPSHTLDSLKAQRGNSPEAVERFAREVPIEHRDACHNMRGVIIDDHTGPAHLLFEAARARGRPIKTIAIGDGGNEIGMGTIPWERLCAALEDEWAGRTICRIAADDLILAGVSDWGAYALACAVANLRSRRGLIAEWDEAGQRELIESLVHEGGAIDGLTRRREPTVDGLPLDVYLGLLAEIRRAC